MLGEQRFFDDYKEEFHPNISKGTFKFIHASDLHLGSHQYRNLNRADDFINAFKEVLHLAINHRVDFIILGGDVFTSLEMLPGKLTEIIQLLQGFKEYTHNSIRIIAIEGNHDIRRFSMGMRFAERGQSWLKLLNTLGLIVLLDADIEAPYSDVFKPYDFETKKGGKIQIKHAVIYGSRYLGENPIRELTKIRKSIQKEDGLFHILIQHFGIYGQMDNIPGVQIQDIIHLKHRVHYLALGHFHKQFTIDDWIYNPGSSESSCSMDFSLKRGVFIVKVKDETPFKKQVFIVKLNNRRHLWKSIMVNKTFHENTLLYDHIIEKLRKESLSNILSQYSSSLKVPVLFLMLKGQKPAKTCKIKEKELRNLIIEHLPVVDVRIYQKFSESLSTIDLYL